MSLHIKHPLVRRLMKLEGKAEIVNGAIMKLPLSGAWPGLAAGEIQVSLHFHAEKTETMRSGGATMAFLSDLPSLRTFCPDACYFQSPTGGESFDPIPYPPLFAAEVREMEDYGAEFERLFRAKIADYFAAGTLVVWDVDLQNEGVVTKYTAQTLDNPQIFRRQELADAEPAVAGWSLPVDALSVRAPR